MHRRLSLVALAVPLLALMPALQAGPALAASAGPAAARTSPPQFTVSPVPAANGDKRGYFQLSAAPGGSASDSVVFTNPSSVTERLTVGVTSGITATDSGSAYGVLTRKCSGIACWVAGLPGTVTLAPHTLERVDFRVNVPAGTRRSQYLVGLAATPAVASAPESVKTRSGGTTKIKVVTRIIVGVAVTVGPVAKLHVDTKVSGVSAAWVDGLVRLTVGVRNDGQRFTKGSGSLTCAKDGITRSYPLTMDTVLPAGSAGLPVNATGMSAGTWNCSARFAETAGVTVRWSGTVVVPNEGPVATKQIGQNDYVAPTGGGIPGWAIALIVLGALILLSIWAMFLRRERMHRTAR